MNITDIDDKVRTGFDKIWLLIFLNGNCLFEMVLMVSDHQKSPTEPPAGAVHSEEAQRLSDTAGCVNSQNGGQNVKLYSFIHKDDVLVEY